MASSKESQAGAKISNGSRENSAGDADPIDQVRELLFGAAKRETENQFGALEQKMEEMRRDFLERLSSLESRLVDLARETEKNQTASVDAIGGAIAQLGATIQTMSARRKG